MMIIMIIIIIIEDLHTLLKKHTNTQNITSAAREYEITAQPPAH